MTVEPSSARVERKARLADTARAGERHEAARIEKLLNLGELCFPSDEVRRLMGKIRASRVARTQRGELAAQSGGIDLVHADRL